LIIVIKVEGGHVVDRAVTAAAKVVAKDLKVGAERAMVLFGFLNVFVGNVEAGVLRGMGNFLFCHHSRM
jgi:hypothetical protein